MLHTMGCCTPRAGRLTVDLPSQPCAASVGSFGEAERVSLRRKLCLPVLCLASIQALVPLLAEDEQETLVLCWEALGAVTASIPKEMQPSFVRCVKVSPGCVRSLGCLLGGRLGSNSSHRIHAKGVAAVLCAPPQGGRVYSAVWGVQAMVSPAGASGGVNLE